VLLRGLNRSGLEYCSPEGDGSLTKAGISEAEFDEIIHTWKAKIIRIPFNQDWALERPDYDAQPYLNALDKVIEMAAIRGAYTLLDLQWLDASTSRGRNQDGTFNFVPSLPDANSIKLWAQLSSRYKDEPAVLYDILNEPHDPLNDDTSPLLGINQDGSTFPLLERRVTMQEWQPWALQLVNEIHTQNADALIFVSGTNWGFDLSGFPIPGLDGVVYSTHIYRNKGSDWDRAFGDLSRDVPVFAGEWGGSDTDVEWGRTLAAYLADHNMGWTAWSWSDDPHLVQPPPGPPYTPTPFGSLVQSLLAN
jgi:hypothetical protein